MKRILFLFLACSAFLVFLSGPRADRDDAEGVAVRAPATKEGEAPPPEKKTSQNAENKGIPAEEVERAEDALARDSRLAWTIRRRGSGITLAGGILPTDKADPLEASQVVLRKYGALIGARPESSALTTWNRESEVSQVVYQQLLDGEPVFGSRINMILNDRGELVHLVSDTYQGPIPPRENDVGMSSASSRVRESLLKLLANREPRPNAAVYSVAFFESKGVRGYRLVSGRVSPVYYFQFSLISPHLGDMEAFVDARDGAVVVLREIGRK